MYNRHAGRSQGTTDHESHERTKDTKKTFVYFVGRPGVEVERQMAIPDELMRRYDDLSKRAADLRSYL